MNIFFPSHAAVIFWLNVVAVWFGVAVVLMMLVLCARMYLRLLRRALAGHGKVWADPLGLPDLLVCAVLVSWLGGMAVFGFLRSAPEPMLTTRTLLDSAALFGAVVCVIVLFLQARQIPVTRLFGLRPAHPFPLIKRGVELFIAALPLVLFCIGAVHLVVRQELEMQEIAKYILDAARQSDWSRFFIAAGVAALVAPVTEEFIFRGYFYGVLRRYVGVIPAMLFTSALFAAIHMNGPVFLPLFVLAMCLTLAYEATGSLLVPMLMHALFNSVMLGTMFYTAHHSL